MAGMKEPCRFGIHALQFCIYRSQVYLFVRKRFYAYIPFMFVFSDCNAKSLFLCDIKDRIVSRLKPDCPTVRCDYFYLIRPLNFLFRTCLILQDTVNCVE